MTPAPGALAIETRDLCRTYATRSALHEVTLAVRPGESYGVLGYEESGKTSLVRVLSGSLHPSKGEARVHGLDATQESDHLSRHLGVLFGEDPLVEPEWTSVEYLDYFDRLQAGLPVGDTFAARRDARKRRLDELAALVRSVGADPDASMERLSPGARRRVDLARAVLHRPSVLLLDEPTKGLDFHARRQVWDQILAWKGAGAAADGHPCTLLVSSSDPEEIVRLACERIAIFRRGLLLAELGRADLGDPKDAGRAVDALAERLVARRP